jgi:uncharacterized DUF497 family protein
MQFEWDPEKARRNLAKHGVSFELAQRVWEDPLHIVVADRIEAGEQRWHAVGLVGSVVVLVVHSHPDREDEERVRIIGARKATPGERKRYEQEGL